MNTPIIGQEAVVPKWGLGRIVAFNFDMPHRFIAVRPYVCDYVMNFEPANVKLVKITLEKRMISFKHSFSSKENC